MYPDTSLMFEHVHNTDQNCNKKVCFLIEKKVKTPRLVSACAQKCEVVHYKQNQS